MSDTASRHARRWLLAGVLLTLAKLWLTRGQTVVAMGQAGHDDRLFLLLAESLVRGEWLGAYDQLTLAKGAFYPLWIALWHVLGVPLFLANQAAYAAACAVFVRALRPALGAGALAFALYAVLLLNPASYDGTALGRVLRQQVNLPQVLLIFATLVALYLRRDRPWQRIAPWAAGLGLALASFWLTREEAVWLAPSVALLGGAWWFGAWRNSAAALRRTVLATAITAVCAAGPVLFVSVQNWRHYGWFGTVEFRAADFQDAYGAMTRVRTGPEIPYVPVTREAREAMYAVSPVFAELRPFLDGDIGRDWAGGSTGLTGHEPGERQIAGGWFMWALRDSVRAAGHAPDARTALRFYRRMAREINAACDDGRLPAGPRRSGFMPVWREGYTAAVRRTWKEFASFTLHFDTVTARPAPSEGSDEDFELFRDFTRERIAPRAGEMAVMGPATALLDLRKVGWLEALGRGTARVLTPLFWLAAVFTACRAAQLLWRRTWSYPLTLALAALGAGAASLLIHALVHVTSYPLLVVSSFAPVYPLVSVFIVAAAWEAVAAWRSRGVAAAASVPPVELSAPEPAAETRRGRIAVAAAGAAALLPFVIWRREFGELFWFGDEFQLLNEIAAMGLPAWTLHVFSENFVPLFKLLWGGSVGLFGGSYAAMLGLLWLTHALNTWLLGRLLLRAGLPAAAAVGVQAVFALTASNLETLGWTVQWSAVLATTFLLAGLLAQDAAAWGDGRWRWRAHGWLVLCAAASACSFSRGVLTGAVLALAVLLPALLARSWRAVHGRIPAAAACLAPAAAVALVISLASSGNHRAMAGHWGDALEFGARFFLLNPFHGLAGSPELTGGVPALLAGLKLAVLAGGLALARGRLRHLLLLLLAYDLGNALLLGIGRHHTGVMAAVSSRYNYGSLLATLPFAAAIAAAAWSRLPAVRWRTALAAVVLAALVWHGVRGWPRELADFTGWRGTEMRALLAEPYTDDPARTIPGVESMHVERAKALVRAYNLH